VKTEKRRENAPLAFIGLSTEEFEMSVLDPPHPGETLRDDVLPALGLTVGAAASALGIDRTTLSKVLNGRSGISPMMALRIEQWLGVDRGGSAERWLSQQLAYDLWQARLTAKHGKTLNSIRTAG
jgi:addiction module HigA family antidote